jgi:hypothetical protein
VGLHTQNVSFYTMSDNVYGLFKYKSTRLVNIRFGMYFLFGCKSSRPDKSLNKCGCSFYRDSETKNEKMEKIKKEMKKEKRKRKRKFLFL